jgi:hypothetical protein
MIRSGHRHGGVALRAHVLKMLPHRVWPARSLLYAPRDSLLARTRGPLAEWLLRLSLAGLPQVVQPSEHDQTQNRLPTRQCQEETKAPKI